MITHDTTEFGRQVPAVRRLALIFLVALPCLPARGDAIVRTQAMTASTIAECFIEDDHVLLELEIGAADLDVFQNLLPDGVYEKLGHSPRPLQERLAQFFTRDLILRAEEGEPLPGRVREIGLRDRIRRDEISGEPLPSSDEEGETVLFVSIEYPLPGRPATLTLGSRITGQVGIGFVVYHQGVAVNDFRYLGPKQTLQLDWADPWYTRFEARVLRRAYFAPMSGFLYMEPYEVRKEIIVRPKDLQHWIDLGLAGRDTIPVEIQADLKQAVLEFLGSHQPVHIDGRPVQPDYQRIDFLERTLTSSRVIDPPEELDSNGAILGVIFIYLTEGLPQRVTMEWDLFNERIGMIPASAVDEAGPLPTYLEPDFAVLEWQNFLKNPELPTLTVLARPPGRAQRLGAMLRWPGVASALALVLWCVARFRRTGSLPGRGLAAVALALVVTAGGFWAARDLRVDGDRARDLVAGLLHNVYRAFDYRAEERIYDVLAESAEGDLLTEIYLQARRGLELASQGGARAKVKAVDLVELDARPAEGGGLAVTATWIVSGSVGHWGHLHQRRNRYRAALEMHPVEGSWKLTSIEILEEERI